MKKVHSDILPCIGLLCASACFMILFASCMTGPIVSRGSLSDGMDAARDGNDGSKEVPTKPVPVYPDQRERDDRNNGSQARNETENDPVEADYSPEASLPWWLAIRTTQEWKNSWKYDSHTEWDLLIGAQASDSVDLAAFAGFKIGTPDSDGSLDASIDGSLVFLKAGIEGRYMPFSSLTIMCPYLSFGAGAYVQLWSYTNAFYSGSDLISSDSLTGMILSAGIGAYPFRSERFRVGASLIAETYMPAMITNQGFDNDYFPITGHIKFAFEVTPIMRK